MSSLVEYLRKADPRYNSVADADLILQTGEPAWAAKQGGDPTLWNAITAEFPDFEGHFHALRDRQGGFTDARNSLLRGAVNDGVLMPAEGIARLVTADGVADWLNEKREAVDTALPVDPGFAESLGGQVVRGVGQMAPMLLGGGAARLVGSAGAQAAILGASAGGQAFQTGVDDARGSGVTDPDDLYGAGLANLPGGLLEYASDKLIVDRVLAPILRNKVLTPRQLMASISTNAAAEGLTEGAQTSLTNYVAASVAGYDPDRPLDANVMESILVGAAVGGVVSGVGTTAANELAKRRPDEPAGKDKEKPAKESVAMQRAQLILARKQAELAAAQANRSVEEPPTAEEEELAIEVGVLEAAIKRDAAKLSGFSPAAVNSALAQVRSDMEAIAKQANDPDAARAQVELRLDEVSRALAEVENRLGPAEEQDEVAGRVVLRRIRERSPDEQQLLAEADRLQQQLAALETEVSQQPAMEGAAAAAPVKDAVDKAIDRAVQKVESAEEAAAAKAGETLIARETGEAGALDEDDPALSLLARELEAPRPTVDELMQEPASGAGSAPDVDASVEAVAPAPLAETRPDEPGLGVVLDEIAKIAPPIALATEPLSKAKTAMSGKAESKDALRGRTIIALRDPESGDVLLRNYYEDKDGNGYAENMGRRGGTRGVGLKRLAESGWEVLDHPWLIAEPAEVNARLSAEDYAAWKQANLRLLDRVQETQREGTPATFFNDLLSQLSPKLVNAVNYLVSTLAAEGGVEPSALYAGVLRPFSESDDAQTNRAQREQMRFVAEARRDPTKILREVNGKVLGIFTPGQFGAYSELVNEGRVDEADAMISKLAGKAAVYDDDSELQEDGRGGVEEVEGVGKKSKAPKAEVARRRFTAWARNMANLGRESLAYWAPGESAGRLVSTEKEVGDGQTVADTIAEEGVANPADAVNDDVVVKDREGLRRFGIGDNEIDYILSELEGVENPSKQDVHDVIEYHDGELAGFERALEDSENPRALFAGAVSALIRLAGAQSEGVVRDSDGAQGRGRGADGREGISGGAREAGERSGAEESRADGAREDTGKEDVADPAESAQGGTAGGANAGDGASEESGSTAAEVSPRAPTKGAKISEVDGVPEGDDLDNLFNELQDELGEDVKFSEPTPSTGSGQAGAVRVGGQEKASVVEKLVKALAMLVEKGVRSFSVALQYIAKRVGSDVAMSAADRLGEVWNRWRTNNPQWGLDKAVSGVKALTGAEAIRPPLQDLGEGKYPQVPDLIKDRYPSLAPEQKLAVNMMVYAAARKESGFLLGDGTGVGKTRQILASAHLLAQYGGGKPVLVLTENRTILDGNFTHDAREMGLISKTQKLSDFPGVKFATYTALAQGHVKADHYAAVFLDEGHKLRNPNSSAHIAEAKLKRDFTVISTATPLDEIYQSIYFLSRVTGMTHEALEQRIGVRITWDKDPFTGLEVPQVESVPGVNEAQATENLKALRDEAMRRGLIVRRVYPFFGKMELMPVQITEQQRREEMRIMASHEDTIQEASSFGGGGNNGGVRVPGRLSQKAKASGQRTLDLARWTESQKAVAIFHDIKQQLAEGKQVAVMSDSSGPRMIQGLGGEQIDGLLDHLAAMLTAEGIDYVDIRGGGNKATAVNSFQSGKAKVTLATLRSGGTGINLDDTSGDAPRVAYIASLPFSALEFDQVIGRFSRRNTKSPAHVKFVFLADQDRQTGNWHPASLSESRRVSNLSRKLALMRMMQGQKIDFDDIFGPMGNVEENERRLLSRSFSAPELGEDAKFSEPMTFTLPFEEEAATTDDYDDPYADIARELMDEGFGVSGIDAATIMEGPDVPAPGKFTVKEEIADRGRRLVNVVYNLENRFLVGMEVMAVPKRSEFATLEDYKASLGLHRTIVSSMVQPGMAYLDPKKIPTEKEPFGRMYFYDLNDPNQYTRSTGAAMEGRKDLAAARATKLKLMEACNKLAELGMERYHLKKFWLGEGGNAGDMGDLGGKRSRIYANARLRGEFKYSEPITEKDLPLMDRSWALPPPSFNYRRYQQLKAALAARGTNLREMQAFAEREKGAFFERGGVKNIWIVAENLLNPTDTDLGILMHEIGHDLFSDLSKAEQVRILRAVARLRSIRGSRFDLDAGSNLSFQRESGERQLEELLVEGLKGEGIEATTATGYAQRLLRTMQALFYETARFVLQQLNRFGWGDDQLDTIALKLFQNRLERFASGDGMDLTVDDFTGGVGTTPEWRAQATGHERAELDPSRDLPPADEGSLAHNLQGLLMESLNPDAKFSRPIGTAERPEERVHQNLAPINHQLEVEQRAMNAVAAQLGPMLANTGNLTPVQVYRSLFGLPDLSAMKGEALNLRDPRTGQLIPNVVPDFTAAMFRAEALAGQAKVDAYDAVVRQRQLVSDQLRSDRGRVAILGNRRARFVQDFDDTRREYLNADGLTRVLMRGIRQMLSDERKKIGLAHERRGMVMQQLRQLDARPVAEIERSFGRVIQRVFRNEIAGREFFDMLDTLRESGIDYQSLRAPAVRRALIDKNLLPQVTADGDDAKVLLSVVLAFAKSHDNVMAKLELRREKSAAERKRIEDELAKLASTKLVNTQRAINALPKTARLEDRLKQSYLIAKRRLKEMNDEIAFIESRIEVANGALPVYDRALSELGAEIGARAIVHFGDGTVVNNPPSHDAAPDAVGKSLFTIRLDTNRQITDRSALLQVAENQTQWLAWRESTGALDPLYLSIKAQRDEILRGIAATEVRPAFQRYKMILAVSPIADRMAAIGTPLARSVGMMVNQFADLFSGIRQQTHRLAFRAEEARDRAMKLLPKGLSLADYKALFLDPAKSIIEKEKSVMEDQALTREQALGRIWVKVKNALIENPTTQGLMGANVDAFAKALRAHVDADYAVGRFYHEFTQQKMELGVRDEKVRVFNPATGQWETGVRNTFEQGAQTFSRTLSPLARQVYRRMVDLGWGGFHSEGIADLYGSGGADAVRQKLAPLLSDPLVARGFLRAMAENDSVAMFDAPVLADGTTQPEADPAKVRIAWESAGGDFVTFAENLFGLHGGTGNVGRYVEQTIGRLAETYGALAATMKDIDPAGAGITIEQVKRMVPGFQVESRVWERMPTAWSSYHTFDRLNTNDFNHRVAAQAAFGRDQERLHNAFAALQSEADRARDTLTALADEVKAEALAKGKVLGSKKEVERAMISVINADEYKRLRAIVDNASMIEPSRRGLIAFFHQDTQGAMGVIRGPLQTVQTIAWGLLQQPTSALMNLTDVFAPVIQLGASPLAMKQSLRMLKEAGSDIFGGLAESFGLQLWRQNHLEEAYHDLGLNDADVERRFLRLTREYDPVDPSKKTNAVPRFLRHWIEAQSFNINRKSSKHTALRPMAPFTTMAMVMNRAATLSMWKTAEDLVLRGLDFMQGNAAASGDAGYKLTAADLGLRRFEAESFKKLEMQMADHGLDLTRMVREAQARMRGPASRRSLLSDQDRLLLHGLAGAETQLESNLATMAPGAYTHPATRLALPLLGWSMRRGLQVPSMFKFSNGRYFVDEQGKLRLQAIALGGLAMAMAAVPALFYSLFIDWFQKEALGKKRNLPGVDGIFADGMTAGDRALIALENLNRVGTFGMIGDVLNMAASSAAGQGDNRSLSLDQRVVAANAAYSLIHAVNTLINQDFEADYAGVIRPAVASLGGNGYLQWAQIANHALDLDNPESRFIRRVNVQNEMRVYGRLHEYDVKPSTRTAAGGSASTPVTPHVVAMQLSALADDYQGFVVAWKKAVAAQLAHGMASTVREAETNVKRSFQARHPLRSVFRSVSRRQYGDMIAGLDDQAAEDVRGAVEAFNRYARTIGVSPYHGGEDKPVRAAIEMDESELRSALMGL